MSDIRDFQFRGQLGIISPNCETSFWFRHQQNILPVDVAFNFRSEGSTVPSVECGGDQNVWVDPSGDTWVDPNGDGWEFIPE